MSSMLSSMKAEHRHSSQRVAPHSRKTMRIGRGEKVCVRKDVFNLHRQELNVSSWINILDSQITGVESSVWPATSLMFVCASCSLFLGSIDPSGKR